MNKVRVVINSLNWIVVGVNIGLSISLGLQGDDWHLQALAGLTCLGYAILCQWMYEERIR